MDVPLKGFSPSGMRERLLPFHSRPVVAPSVGEKPFSMVPPRLANASYVSPQIRFGREKLSSVHLFEESLIEDGAIKSLQDFQHLLMNALEAGNSVVAPTPTSSGKTLIAEYAVWDVLKNPNNENVLKDRVFYTTPRKALSNEKYEEFVQRYGAENVGLMTGDLTINRDAPVVVMTTEILRNAFYDQAENGDLLNNLKYFVLDECHFIDEPYRGMVWEETIMNAPKGVQQIHLSATMNNADEYTKWINSLGGPQAELAPKVERPVPLTKMMMTLDNPPRLVPIFNENGQVSREFEKAFTSSLNKTPSPMNPVQLVKKMFHSEKLPAIFFKFSRRGCTQLAERLAGYKGFARQNKPKAQSEVQPVETRSESQENQDQPFLTTAEEQEKIREITASFIKQYPWLIHSHLLTEQNDLNMETDEPMGPSDNMLTRGVAPHHGGMLPAERKLVETLLKKGLLKAVFATDTLAAGMNVPARTVMLTQFERGNERISHSDLTQMTGRAGRLNMYNRGYAIVPHPKEAMNKQEFLDFMRADSNSVSSRIEVNPRFVLQTLSRLKSDDEVKAYLGKSFLVHQLNGKIEGRHAEPAIKKQLKTEALTEVFNRFQDLKKAMFETGFLTETGKPTQLGHMAKNLFNEHELVLAEALDSELFLDLEPSELAGLMTLFVTQLQEDNNGHKNQFVNLPNGGKDSIRSMATSLQKAESLVSDKLGMARETMDSAYYSVVQGWCEGSDWVQDIMNNPTHEAGNILDVMRRTANLLRQIAELPNLTQAEQGNLGLASPVLISDEMRKKAREASELLLRDEVLEQITPKPIEL